MKTAEILAEMKSLCDDVPTLPFKKFPLVLFSEQPDDKYDAMNKFAQLGLDASHAMPKLIAALEVAQKTLECADKYLSSCGYGVKQNDREPEDYMTLDIKLTLEEISKILGGS